MGNLLMAHLKNFIILLAIHESLSSKACLLFFKNMVLPMHPNFFHNVPNSNVPREQLIAVAIRSFTTNLILSMSSQTWKLPVRLMVSKLSFSQNFTVRSISLSSIGGMQNRYITIFQCLPRRLILKQMSLRLWNWCH
jgi:hypothetical protein